MFVYIRTRGGRQLSCLSVTTCSFYIKDRYTCFWPNLNSYIQRTLDSSCITKQLHAFSSVESCLLALAFLISSKYCSSSLASVKCKATFYSRQNSTTLAKFPLSTEKCSEQKGKSLENPVFMLYLYREIPRTLSIK